MSKAIIVLLILITYNYSYAQDDYVITIPDKKEAHPTLFNSIDNPDFTNYFITPTAFTLHKREIRVSGTDLVFAKGSFGLTNKTTVSANIGFWGMVTGAIKTKIALAQDIIICIALIRL